MKKFLPILLGLLVILLLAVGSAAGSKLMTPAPEVEGKIQPVLNNSQETISKQTVSLAIEEQTINLVAVVQDAAKLEAKLKISGDEVFYCSECTDPETCEFEVVDSNRESVVEGDTIRTGADGAASLKFSDEVDLVLSPNTQIRILKYQEAEDGSVAIYIEHLVGEVYFNVKYSKKESTQFDFRLITPTTVIRQAEQEGKLAFSGVSIVEFGAFAGFTPEEMETAIAENFSDFCGAMCLEENCDTCLAFADLHPVNLQVDDLTGNILIEYIDKTGQKQVTLIASQTFQFLHEGFNSNETWTSLCQALYAILNGETPDGVGEIVSATTGTTTSITKLPNCGDGVCNIYEGEDKKTCPTDCK